MLSRIISKIKCVFGLHSWGGDVWGIAVCKNCGQLTQYLGWAGQQRKKYEKKVGVLSDESAIELYTYFGGVT